MKLYKCQSCGNVLYFENRVCGQCGHRLAYLPERLTLSAVEPIDDMTFKPLATPGEARVLCINSQSDACNWFVPPGTMDAYCVACRHNRIVPDLSQPENVNAWRVLEMAKHRLFYSLLRWKLPLKTVLEDAAHGLSFEFLSDAPPTVPGPKVLTGHDEGKITIAVIEADDVEREKRRRAMGEPYRTVLGHFRHEVGHHYWDILVRDAGKIDACRAVFGDDSQDYDAARQRHYRDGAPADWQDSFVTQYATAHPWEDFAETWAHYLHIVDTLEMVAASGMTVRPKIDKTGDYSAKVDFEPYEADSVQQIVDVWLPYVFSINNVNRAIGATDLYPFVLAPPVMTKLGFIHDLVHGKV